MASSAQTFEWQKAMDGALGKLTETGHKALEDMLADAPVAMAVDEYQARIEAAKELLDEQRTSLTNFPFGFGATAYYLEAFLKNVASNFGKFQSRRLGLEGRRLW